MTVTCAREVGLSAEDYIAVVGATSLGATRPLANPERIRAMLAGANLIVTARDEHGELLGLARCISDSAWICYCADLAVRDSHQGRGIGKALLEKCREVLGPGIGLILVSEPEAEGFYARIGMARYPAFFWPRSDAH